MGMVKVSSTEPRPTNHMRYVRYFLWSGLILNVTMLVCFCVGFLEYRKDQTRLPDAALLEKVVTVLQSQPPEKGRTNAIDLFRRANSALSVTSEIVRQGFYCLAGLIATNLTIIATALYYGKPRDKINPAEVSERGNL